MNHALFRIDGDVAVVTGAGRGIGAGIAHVLAAAGARVVCAARRAPEIEAVAQSIREAGGEAIAVATDVTDDAALEHLADSAVRTFGHLDIWVNNAGGSSLQAPLMQLARAEWDATLLLNLTAVWSATRVAAARMRDGGRVLNISSRAAEAVVPGSGHYCAAKAALNMLTQVFARELGPRIRVNAIMPGMVPTEIAMTAMKLTDADLPRLQKALRLPMERLGTPADLGAAALFLVSPASSWITGEVLSVSGGG